MSARTSVLDGARHRKHHRKHKKHKRQRAARAGARPESFTRHTVRAIRGYNSITLTWPRRLRATGYTVTWFPNSTNQPSSPATCRYPCQHKFTRYTSMRLLSSQLSTYGRRVSSVSGNTVRFRIFSHNGRALNWTGTTYPWDSWIAPSQGATTNWLPVMNSQMPLPYPPAAGRSVGITSFNVLSASAGGWSWRAPRVAKQIMGTGATIVATQENSDSNRGVPGGIAQYQDLANRLKGSGWALADNRNWDYTL
ncbi:MAG: hypothetical protein JOZ82_05875, partial [Marmoricola sp.]|nr:hypothetical protein [Marmoricola sp.]